MASNVLDVVLRHAAQSVGLQPILAHSRGPSRPHAGEWGEDDLVFEAPAAAARDNKGGRDDAHPVAYDNLNVLAGAESSFTVAFGLANNWSRGCRGRPALHRLPGRSRRASQGRPLLVPHAR